MNVHQQRVLQSFRRVQGWIAANSRYTATVAPASMPALATQLAALNGIVERVSNHAAQQESQRAQSLLVSKDEREQRRQLLSLHMAAIVKVARALRGTVPGIGVLVLPRGNVQSAALIAAATAMARTAATYEALLVEQGLPADCIQQLETATATLRRSVDERGLARAARTSATRGVGSDIALGRRVVGIMDATLLHVLRGQPAKMAEWQHVKRVTRRGVVSRVAVEEAESSPTPVQSSPTLVESSRTEIVGSPTATTKAA